MSTYQIRAIADRVILIHDMADQTIFSELDVEQADVLLQQLQTALGHSLASLRANRVSCAA